MTGQRSRWGRGLGWTRGLGFGLCIGVLAFSPLACGDADDSGLFRGQGEGSGGDGAEGGSEGDGGESSADGGSVGSDAGSGGGNGEGGEPGAAGVGSGGAPGEGGKSGMAGDAGSGGDAGKGGEGGMSEGGKGGAGGMGDAGAGGKGDVDCEKLRADVNRRLVVAQSCNPFDDSIQCADWVEGLCCDVVVRSADSEATEAYLKAVKELLSHEECRQPCPLVLCPEPHKGTCAPQQGGGGRCRATILTY